MNDQIASESGREEIIIDPDEFDETIRSVCPDCGTSGDVPSEWDGRTIECKDCGERFTVGEGHTADAETGQQDGGLE